MQNQKPTLAFDVYGTLIDTAGVFSTLEKLIGPKAKKFMEAWRDKQLEYSFRRGLMDRYVDFSVVTKNALGFCCASQNIDLKTDERQALMEEYKTLPAFPDAAPALRQLQSSGHRLFAFSNGSHRAVRGLLEQAGIAGLFEGIVSCEEVKMFKPSPVVYRHFLEKTKSEKETSWLVSGNPFDVIGAVSAGMKGAWVKRSPDAVFDPWEFQPTAVLSNLGGFQNLQGLTDASKV